MTDRRVAVLKQGELPQGALLYRTEHSAWDLRKRVFHYAGRADVFGQDHPLRLLYEHLLVGLQPADLMMLRGVAQVDAAVAAFLYLYPDRINHPSMGEFVDFVCRFERWGSVGSFAGTKPSLLYVLQAIRDVLPSASDQAALSDQALTDVLMDAVSVLDKSFTLDITLGVLPGVETVHHESDRVAFVEVAPGTEEDVWDGIFAAGKVLAAVVRPEVGDGRRNVTFMRRSMLVWDLDFDVFAARLNAAEPGWRMESPLAIVSPAGGTAIPSQDLVSLMVGAVNC
jgi:hypothetical protein